MQVKTRNLECGCHRCNYRWWYHGNSKFIACCPRCKTTIYLPKMIRLMKEERIDIKSRSPVVEIENKNSLDTKVSKSVTSSDNPEPYG
jgi:hypothetical protein